MSNLSTEGEVRALGSGDTAKEMALMALCMMQRKFDAYMSPAMRYDVQTAINLLRRSPEPQVEHEHPRAG
jgi:hypothetical protein